MIVAARVSAELVTVRDAATLPKCGSELQRSVRAETETFRLTKLKPQNPMASGRN